MFSFFHRTPVINIDCFTSNPDVYKFTPVVNAIKAKPEWYESVLKVQKSNTKWPQYKVDENGSIDFNVNLSLRTIRSCPGFLELYKKGFIIENWCDFACNVHENGISFHHSNGMGPIIHSNEQTHPGYKDYYILKLKSPWVITSKENVPFILTSAEWSLEDYDFKILPGILNFYNQSGSNVFVAIKKTNIQQFYIPMGHPLTHLVPLSEKRINITNHCVTEEELSTKRYNIIGTTMGWRRTFSLANRNEERQKKCPFGFGNKE